MCDVTLISDLPPPPHHLCALYQELRELLDKTVTPDHSEEDVEALSKEASSEIMEPIK